MSDTELLADIDKRLAIMEDNAKTDKEDSMVLKRFMLGLFAVFMIQFGSFVYGYAQAIQTLEDIDFGDIRENLTSVRIILADHSTELTLVRTEHNELRTNVTTLWDAHRDFRKVIDAKTANRFYKSDGDKLESRIKRLEDLHVN